MEVILLDLIYDRNVTRAEVQRLSIYKTFPLPQIDNAWCQLSPEFEKEM